MILYEEIANLRPGDPADLLRKAYGASWKEPDCHAEGHVVHDDFSATMTIDDKIGDITFRQSFPLSMTIGGIHIGSPACAFDAAYPNAIYAADDRNKIGWIFKCAKLHDGVEFTVGIKDDEIRILNLVNPNAVYPERPYKYADPLLTDAFDLTLSAPTHLDHRPQNGWCYGMPPAIGEDRWPISPRYGTPLRHAFTLKLPEQYRTQGVELVAISLFVDDIFDTLGALDAPLSTQSPICDPRRFDVEYLDCHYTLFWLTEEEFNGPLGKLPVLDPQIAKPGWLSKSPSDYFGAPDLPSVAFNDHKPQGYMPGGFEVHKLVDTEQPKTGWATLPPHEALNYGLPIIITRREGDPNVGRPAREWDNQNALSGYIPAYSDEGQALNLERFAEFDAHLGGTMFAVQNYPDFSPYYIEFNENFGGFNFGFGIAQLDLKQMLLEWAC